MAATRKPKAQGEKAPRLSKEQAADLRRRAGETERASGASGEGSGSSVPPAAQKASPAHLNGNARISLFKDFVEYQKKHAGE
jgi:hypothetical protein